MTDAAIPAPVSARPSRLWPAVAAGLIGLSWAGAMQVLWRCYQLGGHKWLQGDWLINLAGGPVRRGPLGQGILWVADALGLAPLTLVIVVQALLATALFAGTALLVLRQGQQALVMLVFSGAFFSTLWAADALSGFRKELLPLVALLLVVLPGAGLGRLVLSAGLMALGAWGHEIAVLMLPAWLVALHLMRPTGAPGARAAVIGATALLAAGAAAYALLHPALPQSTAVCAALTQRQTLHPDFCNGAIAWLSIKDNGMTAVLFGLSVGRNVGLLPLALALALGPLAYVCWMGAVGRRLGWLLGLAIAPVCLLYPIALDWGRWLSIQVSIASLILLGLGARGLLPAIKPPRHAVMVMWLVLACASGVQTMTEVRPDALLSRLVRGVRL